MECLNKITDLPDEEVNWRAELERYHHRAELELGHLREALDAREAAWLIHSETESRLRARLRAELPKQ